MFKLVDSQGNTVRIGDTLKTFRGEECILVDTLPPRHSGSTGKVQVSFRDGGIDRVYYASVCGLQYVYDENADTQLYPSQRRFDR